ncbi:MULTISPECIES: Tn3 family transposase [unclassified Streptomyces]|uniref:Tn3 family transposase n=1 Tax=unclassified Streptomyces TaxID=2593676 RepID=UPI00380B357D
MDGFTTSFRAVLLTETCNVDLTPIIRPDVPALTRGRLVQASQGFLRAENISTANGPFIEARAKIDIVRAWGGSVGRPYGGRRPSCSGGRSSRWRSPSVSG